MRVTAFLAIAGVQLAHLARAHHPAAASPATAAGDWRTPRASGGTLDIPRGRGGHFFVTADVAGTPLLLLVDTGATTVALSLKDARAIGVAVDRLTFDERVTTASGEVRAAHTALPQLRVGDIQLLDVAADVLDVEDGMALLGRSFLGRIDQVSIRGDTMRLTTG